MCMWDENKGYQCEGMIDIGDLVKFSKPLHDVIEKVANLCD